jgi:hypothetical protein
VVVKGWDDMAQIVYVFTNPVMPGILKIGKTDNEDVTKRAKALFTTGVPVPFDCVCASEVINNDDVEKALHSRFAKYRVNPKREFFWLTAKTVVKALKAYELVDATPTIREDADRKIPESEKEARWKARQKTIGQFPEYARGKDLHQNIRKSNGR